MNKKKCLLLFSGFFLIFIITIVSAGFTIHLNPRDNFNQKMPDMTINYTWEFTTNADCTGILYTNTSEFTMNEDGEGFIDFDLSTMTGIPNYICEYRTGALRKIHDAPTGVFSQIYAESANFSGNVSASNFLGNLNASYIQNTPWLSIYTEADPFWTANFTLYNDSWTSTYNSTYNIWAYNQTIPAINAILGLNYYNSSDFSISDYYLKSNPFNFYNITDFDINNYYLKSNPFGFYNSTDFSIGDYYLKNNPFEFYNSTDFSISDYYLKNNPFGFYNLTDFDINDYYPLNNPYNYINTTGEPLWTANWTADQYLFNTGDTASGTYNFDSDTLVIDATNDRVGIGTSSPDQKLDVEAGNIRITETGTTERYLEIGVGRTDDGHSYIDLIGDATYTDYGLRVMRRSTANGYSQLQHRGTGYFEIDTSQENADIYLHTGTGNVGIGTSSPSEMITIEEQATQSAMIGFDDTDHARFGIIGLVRGNDDVIIGTTVNDFIINVESATKNIIFGVDEKERARVSIDGFAIKEQSDFSAVVRFEDSDNTLSSVMGVARTTNEIVTGTALNDLIIANKVSDKDIIFSVNDGGAQTEVMRIDGATTNVGIGTGSPDYLLEISKSTAPTVAITNSDTTITSIGQSLGKLSFVTADTSGAAGERISFNALAEDISGVNFGLAINTGVYGSPDTEVVRITSLGKVGIGTATPSKLLTLMTSADVELIGTTDADLNIYSGSGKKLYLGSNAAHLTIDTDGDVGIGDTTPDAKLDVAGDIIMEGSNLWGGVFGTDDVSAGIYLDVKETYNECVWSDPNCINPTKTYPSCDTYEFSTGDTKYVDTGMDCSARGNEPEGYCEAGIKYRTYRACLDVQIV